MCEYAYVRVSSMEQNEDRQLVEVKKIGIKDENIFIDKQSGKDFDRPMYRKLKEKLQPNDIVYVLSIAGRLRSACKKMGTGQDHNGDNRKAV